MTSQGSWEFRHVDVTDVATVSHRRSGRGAGTTTSEAETMGLQFEEHAGDAPARRLRVLVAALVGVEAIGLVLGSVVLAVDGLQPLRTATLALAAIALVLGVGLAVCAWGVAQGATWTRGPVVTWQLLQAGVGMPVSTSSTWWFGVLLLALSVVVGVLMAGRHVVRPRPIAPEDDQLRA